MKSKLTRVFSAAAIAGATIFGTANAQNQPNGTPLSQDQMEALFEMGRTFYTVSEMARVNSVVSPDMRQLGAEAIRELAAQSATDQLTLTRQNEDAISYALTAPAPNPQTGDRTIEALAYVLLDVMQRAVVDGMPMADVDAASVAMINQMLAQLDSHSSYSTPEATAEMMQQMSGRFGGIGIQIRDDNGTGVVESIIAGGPSENENIMAGDRIVEVDGQDVTGAGLESVVDKIRGELGQDVTVTIERNGTRLAPLTITRGTVKESTVHVETISDDIARVSVSSFGNDTAADLETAIIELRTTLPNMKGFVLDLRGNPGGLLPQAIAVSDLFLETGNIVSVGNGTATDQRFGARPGDVLNGLPMVVLMSDGSASASEIVAGALQGNDRATIMGFQSFGKGTVQTVIPLRHNGGALRLTTALYFTATGISIQGNGITPDVAFENEELRTLRADPNFRLRREADLSHTLPNPNVGIDTTQTAAICEPVAGADVATVPQADEALKFTLRDGTEKVDFMTACAVSFLRPGTASPLTVTRPVPPSPAPAP